VEAALTDPPDQEITVLKGFCYPSPDCGPYFPFFQILNSLSLLDSPSNIVKQVAGSALSSANWINLSEDWGERRERFLRQLTSIILKVIGLSRTVFLLEDIHWADTGTLLLINTLMDVSDTNLQMICTARTDEPLDPDARQLISRIEQKSVPIHLHGLPSSDTRQLLEQLIGSGYVTDEEMFAATTYTRGNPLFLRELIHHLKSSGLLERYSLQEALTLNSKPESLTHVVDLRLRTLSKPLKEVLQTSAVLGNEFTANRVSRVAAITYPKAIELLRLGVEKHVLEPLNGHEGERYRFSHPLLADRLYDTLSESSRRGLHQSIAATLQEDGNTESAITDLAHHFALGFGPSGGRRGIRYCQLAAEQAEQIMAFDVAARFWRLAITCTHPSSRVVPARLFARLGWSLWAAGKWEQAVEAWNKAVLRYQSLNHRRKVGELSLALGDVHRWRMELDEARHWLKVALTSPLARADRARALALLANTLCLKREVNDAKEPLEEATKIWAEVECDPLVAFWLSHAYLMIGRPSQSLFMLRSGFEEAKRRGSSHAITLLSMSVASHYLCVLDVEAASSHIASAEQAIDPGDVTNLPQLWSVKVYLLGYLGEWDNVIETCESWMARVRLSGPYQLAFARLVWAEAQFASGRAPVAARAAVQALESLGDFTPVGAVHLGRMMVNLGHMEEAEQLVRTYASLINATPRYASARGVLGDVVSRLETPDLWRQCYDSLMPERRAMLLTACATSVQRVLGRLATRLGMWQQAVERFEQALSELEKGRAHWELANTYVDYAELRTRRRRRGDLTKASAMEARAKAIIAELGLDNALPRFSSKSPDNGTRYGLTGREIEVLALLSEGRRNREIADSLMLSLRTVERHLENIFGKMGLNSRTEVILRAVQEGIVGPFGAPGGTASARTGDSP
jgi:DNA-binding CsgD family transcriptional regulator